MNVTFYSFAKRSNSTAQPDAGAGTVLTCQLKEECNMVTPVLIINAVPTGLNPIWNYAYIPGFNRYYFINDWRWKNGVWESYLNCDVLASFKTEIGSLSEYVVRAASEYNGQVVDLQYPTTAETRVDATMLTNRFQSVYAGGYYILGVISCDSRNAMGAVTYYQMSADQFADFKAYILSEDFLGDQDLLESVVLDVIPKDLLKTLYNPFSYIVTCLWLPFPMSEYISSLKTEVPIYFGWWSPKDDGTNIKGYLLNANGYVRTTSERIAVAGHPQRFDRGVFLDHAPFVDRMLYYPPFGSIPINDDSIIGGDFIRIELTVDMVLGDGVLTVYHDRPIGQDQYNNLGVIARMSAPLAVPIQIAQTTVDYMGSAMAIGTNAAQGIGKSFINAAKKDTGIFGFLSEGIGGSISAGIAAIGDVIQNPVGQVQTSGSNGSVAQYSTHPYFIEKWRIVADDDNAQKGRPLCAVRTLNTLSGFIMVDSPDVRISCFETERQQIVNFLESGFFYE